MAFDLKKVKKQALLPPAIEEIKQGIAKIDAMTRIDINQVKTAVYWAICTHGHKDKLKKFPFLRFTGDSETGKSDLTEIVSDLSKKPHLGGDIKAWTDAGIS